MDEVRFEFSDIEDLHVFDASFLAFILYMPGVVSMGLGHLEGFDEVGWAIASFGHDPDKPLHGELPLAVGSIPAIKVFAERVDVEMQKLGFGSVWIEGDPFEGVEKEASHGEG